MAGFLGLGVLGDDAFASSSSMESSNSLSGNVTHNWSIQGEFDDISNSLNASINLIFNIFDSDLSVDTENSLLGNSSFTFTTAALLLDNNPANLTGSTIFTFGMTGIFHDPVTISGSIDLAFNLMGILQRTAIPEESSERYMKILDEY